MHSLKYSSVSALLQPMAFGHASCVWTLVLGACVALAMGTDCGKECALCVYRLLGQQPPLTSPVTSNTSVTNMNNHNGNILHLI